MNKKVVDKDILESLIRDGYQCKDILSKIGISKSTLYKYLKKYKLSITYEQSFDYNIFDNIDSEEKAYWLGFLYADGFINGKYNNSVELSLSELDKDHLEKYRKFIGSKTPITVSKITSNGKEFSRCRCLVTNKHFHDRLIELGCISNKSLVLSFVDIDIFSDKSLVYHFIRGYVDGDGSLYKVGRTGRLGITIQGTREFLTEMMKYFGDSFKNLYSTRSSKIGKNSYQIMCENNLADNVGRLLYNNATIYLERKQNKFAELCRNMQPNNGANTVNGENPDTVLTVDDYERRLSSVEHRG